MGHNDHTIAEELLNKNIGSGVILSPRHFDYEKIINLSDKFRNMEKEVYFDPQLYNPQFRHRDGYPSIGSSTVEEFSTYSVRRETIVQQLEYQMENLFTGIIIPMPFGRQMSDSWLNLLRLICEYTIDWKLKNDVDSLIYMTVPVSSVIVSEKASREALLNQLTALDVSGFYLVCESPRNELFPTDQDYLFGIMDLVFQLKRNYYRVVMGYSCFYSALLFPLGLDGFCSGGFNNRRSFDFGEWEEVEASDEIRSPKPRYYSPITLSSFIYPDDADLLFAKGKWNIENMGATEYSRILFDGQLPSTKIAVWKRKLSFLHYLATCDELVQSFHDLGSEQRLEKVTSKLRKSLEVRDDINSSVRLRVDSQARHLNVWNSAFLHYLEEINTELEETYR